MSVTIEAEIPVVEITSINVGERHRKDPGDLKSLAASLKAVGLLHPVVLNSSLDLIAGGRRLLAAKSLGWTQIPAVVATTLDDVHTALLAERDENLCRLDFKPSEAVAVAKALEPFEKEAAKQRMEAGNGGSENFSEGTGNAAAKVGKAVQMSAPTLAKAKLVVEAAKAHPEFYGDIAEKMDKTGKVAPAYAQLEKRSKEPGSPAVKLIPTKKKAESGGGGTTSGGDGATTAAGGTATESTGTPAAETSTSATAGATEASAAAEEKEEEKSLATAAEPWLDFNAEVAVLAKSIRAVSRDAQKVLGLTADGKRSIEWAHFMSHPGTVGQLLDVAKTIENNVPAGKSPKPPGFIPLRQFKLSQSIGRK